MLHSILFVGDLITSGKVTIHHIQDSPIVDFNDIKQNSLSLNFNYHNNAPTPYGLFLHLGGVHIWGEELSFMYLMMDIYIFVTEFQ